MGFAPKILSAARAEFDGIDRHGLVVVSTP
jgi:hypothetical protein